MGDIWSELGIAPTGDAAAIRRVYAARLKARRPDDDPQAFARLRAAYEAALRFSDPARRRVEPATAAPVERAAPDPVGEILRRAGVAAAAAWLVDARARGSLTLQQDIACADRLGWAMAQDASLPPNGVRHAARSLGWRAAMPASAWAPHLRRRLDAEEWLDAVRADAASWPATLGGGAATAARILLGRGRLRPALGIGEDPMLVRRYGEFLHHAPVIGGEFDPARVDAVARLVSRRKSIISALAVPIAGTAVFGFVESQAPDANSLWRAGFSGGFLLCLMLVIWQKRWLSRLLADRFRPP